MPTSLTSAIESRFSKWVPWTARYELPNMDCPGVYAIAYSTRNLSGRPFRWSSAVIYVGMTNSAGGLRARLRQFDNTMQHKEGHGGAQRVRRKHRHYATFCRRAFVAVMACRCSPKSNSPKDIRKMGDVARSEYHCIAEFAERFGNLPEFNDKQRSPKLTLT